jgi:uncharacterized membrane protein YccC
MHRLRALALLMCGIAILQLGLLWVQGAQLYRQNQILVAMHHDLQEVAEALDQLSGGDPGQESESWSPSHTDLHRRKTLLRIRQETAPAPEEDPAAKELRQSKESAEKAVKEARQAQQKLSITEAAKRAEEKQKIASAENAWMKWVYGSLGVLVLAFLARAWWRNRG